MLPSSLLITGVTDREISGSTGISDIYTAMYHGQPVAIKRLRNSQSAHERSLFEVRTCSVHLFAPKFWDLMGAIGVMSRNAHMETAQTSVYPAFPWNVQYPLELRAPSLFGVTLGNAWERRFVFLDNPIGHATAGCGEVVRTMGQS